MINKIVPKEEVFVQSASRLQRIIVFLYGATVCFSYWRVSYNGLFPPSAGSSGLPHLLEVTTISLTVYLLIVSGPSFVQALKDFKIKIWILFILWALFIDYFNVLNYSYDATPGAIRLTIIIPGFALLLGLTLSKIEGCADSLAKGLLVGGTVLCISMLWPDLFPSGWASKGHMMAYGAELVGQRSPGLFAHQIGGGGMAAEFVTLLFILPCGVRIDNYSPWIKVFIAGLIVLWAFAIGVSMVRSAIIAIFLIISLWFLVVAFGHKFKGPNHSGTNYLIAYLSVTIVLIIILNSDTFIRLTRPFTEGNMMSEEGRFHLWGNALMTMIEEPLIFVFGVGVGKGLIAHNLIIQYLWSTGILGLFVIILILKDCFLSPTLMRETDHLSNFIDGSLMGWYFIVFIIVYGTTAGFLVQMAASVLTMLMIGCFIYPSNRAREASIMCNSMQQNNLMDGPQYAKK
jgi:hypothetical protein